MANELYEQCEGKIAIGLRSVDRMRRRPGSYGEGARTQSGAKALAAPEKATARALEAKVGKLQRRLLGQRLWNQGKPSLGSVTGPWTGDGSSTVAQQTKAVKERRYPNCPRRLVIA